RQFKRSKSCGPKSSAKKVGRPNNQPKAQYAQEYMQKKQKYKPKSKQFDRISVAKVPYILQNIGQLETVQADPTITIEEADAGIQGYEGKVRQLRHYGGYDHNDLIES
ncbi:MAG: hypothetical protein EZS28_034884, partial [Streblomastix strix]